MKKVTKSNCKSAFKAIGYTNDHQTVFMTHEGNGPDNRPMEFTMTWTPKDALIIAKNLAEAARACTQSPIILPGKLNHG